MRHCLCWSFAGILLISEAHSARAWPSLPLLGGGLRPWLLHGRRRELGAAAGRLAFTWAAGGIFWGLLEELLRAGGGLRFHEVYLSLASRLLGGTFRLLGLLLRHRRVDGGLLVRGSCALELVQELPVAAAVEAAEGFPDAAGGARARPQWGGQEVSLRRWWGPPHWGRAGAAAARASDTCSSLSRVSRSSCSRAYASR